MWRICEDLDLWVEASLCESYVVVVLFWYYEAIVASFACGDGWNSDKLLTVVVICEMRIMQHFSSEDRMTVNGFSKKHLDGEKLRSSLSL